MRITDVVTATTINPLYSDFIPAFIQCWKSLIPEIRIWIVIVADRIPKNLEPYSPHLVLFPAPQGVHEVFVSQMIRLLFPGTLKSDGAVLITDMDMLPLNSKYYHAGVAGISSDQFVIYRDDIDNGEIPMCYCAATAPVWKNLFGCGDLGEIPDKLRSLIPSGYDGASGGSGWYSDQKYLYQVVMNSSVPRKIWTDPELGFARLDRAYMGDLNDHHLTQVRNRQYCDYHAKRPFDQYREENMRVVNALCGRYSSKVQMVDPDSSHARIEDIYPEDIWPKFLLGTHPNPIEDCVRQTGSWEIPAILEVQKLLKSSGVFLDMDPDFGLWVISLVRFSRPNMTGLALAGLQDHQLAGNVFLNGLSDRITLISESQLDHYRPDLIRVEQVWKLRVIASTKLLDHHPILLVRNSPENRSELQLMGWKVEEFSGYLKATFHLNLQPCCNCQIPANRHYFIGHNGGRMENNTSFYFADRFHWIGTRNILIKKPIDSKELLTIYLKLDYIGKWIEELMKLDRPFILVTGCSDYSPKINFTAEYQRILTHPYLTKWYGENIAIDNHPKVFPLTVGLATHQIQHGLKLMDIHRRIDPRVKTDKIFSCFRARNENCCGVEYLERDHCNTLLDRHPQMFENFENLDPSRFMRTLSEYRWCFCPLGNGLDHSPKLLECLLVKTIPICRKTPNSYRLYRDYPIIWIDDFEQDMGSLDRFENYDWCRIPVEFSDEFWFQKILA